MDSPIWGMMMSVGIVLSFEAHGWSGGP